MERYWVFMWEGWEACGGFSDFVDSFPTKRTAVNHCKRVMKDRTCRPSQDWQVVDSHTGKIVEHDT